MRGEIPFMSDDFHKNDIFMSFMMICSNRGLSSLKIERLLV